MKGNKKYMYKSKFQTINKADKQQNIEKDREWSGKNTCNWERARLIKMHSARAGMLINFFSAN